MKFMQPFTLILALLLAMTPLAGQAKQKGLKLSNGQITVSIGPEILNDKKKAKLMRKADVVETVFKYMTKRAKKMKLDEAITVKITLTTLRIGFGRDHMGATVLVERGDEEVGRFDTVETTSRGSGKKGVAKKLSKGIAKRIAERVNTLLEGDKKGALDPVAVPA